MDAPKSREKTDSVVFSSLQQAERRVLAVDGGRQGGMGHRPANERFRWGLILDFDECLAKKTVGLVDMLACRMGLAKAIGFGTLGPQFPRRALYTQATVRRW